MKQARPACRQAGMTLLEILVAMGLSVVIGILLVAIIINSSGLYTNQSTKLVEGHNINDALLNIKSTIRQSNAIIASYINGLESYSSSSSQLVLRLFSIDSSGAIIPNTYDYFVYFLDQNKLRLKTFPDPLSSRFSQNQIFSTLADSLSIKYLNSGSPPVEVTLTAATRIKVTITLKEKKGLSEVIKIATTEASLRND